MRETESPVAENGNEFMNLKNDLMQRKQESLGITHTDIVRSVV